MGRKKVTEATTTAVAEKKGFGDLESILTECFSEKINKAEAIRQVAEKRPDLKPSEIAKAFEEFGGIEVTAGRVSTVLRKATAKPAIDMESIKAAGTFLKAFDGEIEDAAASIESVGEFVESCGSKDKALAALVAFKEAKELFGS